MNDFFANILELWGINIPPIGDGLYDNYLYSTIGFVMVSIAFAGFVTFYYLLNSTRFNKRMHWLLILLFAAFSTTLFSFIYTFSNFLKLGLHGENGYHFGDYIQFLITVFIETSFFFFLFSMLGKHWSSNCKDCPIKTRK